MKEALSVTESKNDLFTPVAKIMLETWSEFIDINENFSDNSVKSSVTFIYRKYRSRQVISKPVLFIIFC